MIKKVLISLDELIELADLAYSLPDAEWMNPGNARKQIEQDCGLWFYSQPAASQWVSVEDELPDESMDVFAIMFFDKRDMRKAHFCKNSNAFYLYDGGVRYEIDRFTHWMPIPPLPGVKDGA